MYIHKVNLLNQYDHSHFHARLKQLPTVFQPLVARPKLPLCVVTKLEANLRQLVAFKVQHVELLTSGRFSRFKLETHCAVALVGRPMRVDARASVAYKHGV